MSNCSSGSLFATSSASDNSYTETMPIVRLLEDVDTYAGDVFDMSAQTLNKLYRDRGQPFDRTKLDEQEKHLTSFHPIIEKFRTDLANMKFGDFAALSLVWGSGVEVVGKDLQAIIEKLAGIESQVADLRDDSHINRNTRGVGSWSETANELFARHTSLKNIHTADGAIRYHRDIHPCQGALQLLKGDDRGDIDRCLRNDLTPNEVDRLNRGGNRGAYLFWKCNSCGFRIKYFVSKSRNASLLTNNDNLTFKDSNVQCTRAFIAMSHVEQQQAKKRGSSSGPPKYTCLVCALHRPATQSGQDHTFSKRDDYISHLKTVHLDGNPPPAFVLQKLRIEHGNELPDGIRREMWTG